MTKYDIKQSGDDVHVIGFINWSPEHWDYQTNDAEIDSLLGEVKAKGEVTGYTSFEDEDAIYCFVEDKVVTCPPKTGPGVMLVLDLKNRGGHMARKRHTPEQVINKLREAEVALAQGSTVAEASRQIGVTEQTFYRWRNEYGGLRIDQVKRLKQLETENTRLKRAVADLTLDNQILKEAAEGNF